MTYSAIRITDTKGLAGAFQQMSKETNLLLAPAFPIPMPLFLPARAVTFP
ncbi:hypothetical protein [Geobacter hydrogenophilus]